MFVNLLLLIITFIISDSRLQATIYPIIQDKLGTALTNWHPSDGSAKLMLQPWQRALSRGAFVAFLLKHIVPKLQQCMQNLIINPHQQLLGNRLFLWVQSRLFKIIFFNNFDI